MSTAIDVKEEIKMETPESNSIKDNTEKSVNVTEKIEDSAETIGGNAQPTTGGDEHEGANGSERNETAENPVDTEDPQMVWLRRYLAKSMGILFEDAPECLLDEVSFEGIARYIASDRCNKVVVMTGAGISTSAGIPDFRSPNTGCYEQLKKEYNIENPQQLFEYSYFKDNPEPYYKYRKELWRGTYKPTPCHYFIRMLENKNKLLRHFTQNIDGLELLAGISDDKLIQAHGSINHSYCMQCGQSYTQKWVRAKIYGPDGPVPRCSDVSCRGIVRPQIVMFGEKLPDKFAEHVSDIDECDLLLIMGTSLVVRPFANLPIRTKDNVPRLYINLENTSTAKHPISALFFGGGFDFDKDDNIRDVFWKGKCDKGCFALADIIGWGDELRAFVNEEHTRLNKELGLSDETALSRQTTIATKSSPPQKPSSLVTQKQETKRVQPPISGQTTKQTITNGTRKTSQESNRQEVISTRRKTSVTSTPSVKQSVMKKSSSRK